jgi:hypothetical protein
MALAMAEPTPAGPDLAKQIRATVPGQGLTKGNRFPSTPRARAAVSGLNFSPNRKPATVLVLRMIR